MKGKNEIKRRKSISNLKFAILKKCFEITELNLEHYEFMHF